MMPNLRKLLALPFPPLPLPSSRPLGVPSRISRTPEPDVQVKPCSTVSFIHNPVCHFCTPELVSTLNMQDNN